MPDQDILPEQIPFGVTKASDFSDEEILSYWVDLSELGGVAGIAKPASPMPMYILGGKGSGKTHLMRYLSYSSQRLRYTEDLLRGIQSDGYLGIYMRCSGLNSARFNGKGQQDAAWLDVFAYHFELWLAQLAVDAARGCLVSAKSFCDSESSCSHDIYQLFDAKSEVVPGTLAEVSEFLANKRRYVDLAVNNCSITQRLDVRIEASRGRLIFGIPQILVQYVRPLSDCRFVYLLDEFENLSEAQQTYVNTLVREKEAPCTFKIGSRLYGVKTHMTFSGKEENKQDSEYELLHLDALLRRSDEQYRKFAVRLIVKRLAEHGYVSPIASALKDATESSNQWFDVIDEGDLAASLTSFVSEKYQGRERPYFKSLKSQLEEGWRLGLAPGVKTEADITVVIERLLCEDFPLLEKINRLLLYREWYARNDLVEASEGIRKECAAYLEQRPTAGRYWDTLLHFKADMLAQVFRECDRKQRYVGLPTFIDMSWGLPRNLLVTLKNVCSWAMFKEERPFRDRPISINAQMEGVSEATNWFFRDHRPTGSDGPDVQDAISRLATLFRGIRYSDKPSECSLCAFSCDLSQVSEEARRRVDLAQKWSLLVDVGSQRDRNSERLDVKLQLNRMIAPRWDLPIFRRGVLALNPSEVDAIFAPEEKREFTEVLSERVSRMTAPRFGRKPESASKDASGQQFLGFGDND